MVVASVGFGRLDCCSSEERAEGSNAESWNQEITSNFPIGRPSHPSSVMASKYSITPAVRYKTRTRRRNAHRSKGQMSGLNMSGLLDSAKTFSNWSKDPHHGCTKAPTISRSSFVHLRPSNSMPSRPMVGTQKTLACVLAWSALSEAGRVLRETEHKRREHIEPFPEAYANH